MTNRPGEIVNEAGYPIAFNMEDRDRLDGYWMDMYGRVIGLITEEGTWDLNGNRLSAGKNPALLLQFASPQLRRFYRPELSTTSDRLMEEMERGDIARELLGDPIEEIMGPDPLEEALGGDPLGEDYDPFITSERMPWEEDPWSDPEEPL